MRLSNTATTYGSVTKTFHWVTALLILTLFPLGFIANRMPYETSEQLATKGWLFSMHKTLGVTLFLIAVLRILWALSQPKPGLLHPDRKLESWAAETAHWLLYGSLVLAPLSGWVHHAATSGFAPIWWPLGQNLPLVPKSESLAALTAGLHSVFTKVMGVALLAHIAGALKHHVIDRDATLRRMLPGTPDLPDLAPAPHGKAPLASALAIWAAALALGSILGVYHGHDAPQPEAVALKDVASEWQVQEGSIDISLLQFGNEVTGSFADWTASISFDRDRNFGKLGEVDVTISIASLELGSVTAQALGPDFFDAQTFPTATYVGDITPASDGYEVDGTLTIKDTSMPLRLPFSLSFEDEVATMLGRITLDRRSFGVGANLSDEKTLGFSVDVVIGLKAAPAE